MSDIKIGKSLITEEHDKIINEYDGYISSLTSAMEKEYSYHTIRIAAIDDIENELNNIGLVIYTLYTRGDEIYISAKRIDDDTYNIKITFMGSGLTWYKECDHRNRNPNKKIK